MIRFGVWRLRYGSYQLVAVTPVLREAEAIARIVPGGAIISPKRPDDPWPRSALYLRDTSSDWGGFDNS